MAMLTGVAHLALRLAGSCDSRCRLLLQHHLTCPQLLLRHLPLHCAARTTLLSTAAVLRIYNVWCLPLLPLQQTARRVSMRRLRHYLTYHAGMRLLHITWLAGRKNETCL